MTIKREAFWTPFPYDIDENFLKTKFKKRGGGGVSGHESQKIKRNPNHDSQKLRQRLKIGN